MVELLTKKSLNKQNLIAIVINSQYPECWIKGGEARRILAVTKDDGNFDLPPYGQSSVFVVEYGELEPDGTVSGTPIGVESLYFPDYVKLGKPLIISVERTEVFRKLD